MSQGFLVHFIKFCCASRRSFAYFYAKSTEFGYNIPEFDDYWLANWSAFFNDFLPSGAHVNGLPDPSCAFPDFSYCCGCGCGYGLGAIILFSVFLSPTISHLPFWHLTVLQTPLWHSVFCDDIYLWAPWFPLPFSES